MKINDQAALHSDGCVPWVSHPRTGAGDNWSITWPSKPKGMTIYGPMRWRISGFLVR
jgi:hypothetical protein